jgi:hypothetical protein
MNLIWLKQWAHNFQSAQIRWRWLGYLLLCASLAYVISILAHGWQQISQIAWETCMPVILAAMGIYLLSLLLQLFVWSRLLSFHHRGRWWDIKIYCRTILLRHLPGGIWHWVGRTALYQSEANLSMQVVTLANFWEWCVLILVAIGIYAVSLSWAGTLIRITLGFASITGGMALAVGWQPANRRIAIRLSEGLLWIGLYILAWFMGGWIVHLLIQFTSGYTLSLIDATGIWALAGGSSLFLAVILPAGLGVREVALTWLLQHYTSKPMAMFIAFLIRLIFTTADIIWGGAGWALSRSMMRSSCEP